MFQGFSLDTFTIELWKIEHHFRPYRTFYLDHPRTTSINSADRLYHRSTMVVRSVRTDDDDPILCTPKAAASTESDLLSGVTT